MWLFKSSILKNQALFYFLTEFIFNPNSGGGWLGDLQMSKMVLVTTASSFCDYWCNWEE
jgi:hypothetical protein